MGWRRTTLGQAFKWASGGTPKRDNIAFYDGSIPWVIIGDLNDVVVSATETNITDAGLDNSSAKWVEPDSVLIAMYGSIGKLGIAGVRLTTNQAIAHTKPECCSTKYLYWYLVSSRDQLKFLGKGGTQQNISLTVLKAFPFLLAPPKEQERIVAELETQLTRLDASVTAVKRVQANLKRYRASVLKAACEGRLVYNEAELARRENRIYESGSDFLMRVLASRTAKPRRQERIEVPDARSLSPLPEGWTWATLPQLGELNRGKSKHRPRDDERLYGGPYPFIQTGDIRKSAGTVRDHSQTYSEFGLTQSRLWPAGTLCITIAANIAETSVLAYPACFPDSVVGFVHQGSRETTRWVDFFLRTAREELERFAPATAQKNINLDVLSRVAVPVPPLSEQHRIVAEVERRFSVIERIEATVAGNLKRAGRLRQAVLQRAFKEPRPVEYPTTASAEIAAAPTVKKPNRHFARALLSAEIVHQLHNEITFGRIKHQKIFHLCEHIARIPEIEGQYHREAAGPLDNKLIYANEAELKKQKWYEETQRGEFGHSYRALPKAGGHNKYLERHWPDRLDTIRKLIERMRGWDTQTCEIFSTAYAAWNDLLLWGREPTEDAILHEILNRWHDSKREIPEERWRKAIAWIEREGYSPSGFGVPTAAPEEEPS